MDEGSDMEKIEVMNESPPNKKTRSGVNFSTFMQLMAPLVFQLSLQADSVGPEEYEMLIKQQIEYEERMDFFPSYGSDQEIEPILICPLCRRFITEPVMTPCNHTYCGRCLRKWSKYALCCPLDNIPLTGPLMFYSSYQLERFETKCSHPNCQMVVELRHLREHEDNCRFGLGRSSSERSFVFPQPSTSSPG